MSLRFVLVCTDDNYFGASSPKHCHRYTQHPTQSHYTDNKPVSKEKVREIPTHSGERPWVLRLTC